MTYVVTAYRWGWRNGHSYVIYAGPDRAHALAVAEGEPKYRGGKYATEVVEYGAAGGREQVREVIAAFGDPIGHNHRIDTLANIGGDVWNAAEGFIYGRAADGVEPELTPWVRGVVWRHAQMEVKR